MSRWYVGIVACALLVASGDLASAGIRCCHTRTNRVAKCRVRSARACRRNGGVDIGPGTCHPNPCAASTTTATTTSTTSTTTTTVAGGGNAQHVQLLIQALDAPPACGGPGYETAASPPFSGEVDDATGAKLDDLQLGCVYVGGAAAGQAGGGAPITSRSYGGGTLVVEGDEDEGTRVTLSPSDHPGSLGCSRGAGPRRHCLGGGPTGSECTTDADCGGTPGTCQPDTHCYTTEPIDYAQTGIAGFVVCLINIVEEDVRGTVDLATGEISQTLPLATRVYLSACPKCVDDRCAGGKDAGNSCDTHEGGGTSVSCLPLDSAYFGVIETPFTSTTGTSELASDPTGTFCAGQPHPGAFGLAAARDIVQHGSPAGDIRDGEPHEFTKASTGCVPASSNGSITQFGGLPFPLAVATRATVQLR